METTWFALLCFLIIGHVVLDGFDLGAGILKPFIAKTDREHRTVLAAIGPVWNGNEVWLVAFGGVLFFSFPAVYAAAFSGLYRPLMLLLLLLIMRGVSIELRSKKPGPAWRAFWDWTFTASSGAMALVLGVVLGNLIRGVPLGPGAQLHMPLVADMQPGPDAGAIDWYTLVVGGFAATVLAAHGATYVAWKTDGLLQVQGARMAHVLWSAATAGIVPTTYATALVAPHIYAGIYARPLGWPFAVCVAASLVAIFWALRSGRDFHAFMASSAFIVSMLAATAVGLYPDLLRSNEDATFSLTVQGSAIEPSGLSAGLVWFVPAIALAVTYVAHVYRALRGKVDASGGHEGY
jgi:cytochrome d ubiquinol oxidase subunit II